MKSQLRFDLERAETALVKAQERRDRLLARLQRHCRHRQLSYAESVSSFDGETTRYWLCERCGLCDVGWTCDKVFGRFVSVSTERTKAISMEKLRLLSRHDMRKDR